MRNKDPKIFNKLKYNDLWWIFFENSSKRNAIKISNIPKSPMIIFMLTIIDGGSFLMKVV